MKKTLLLSAAALLAATAQGQLRSDMVELATADVQGHLVAELAEGTAVDAIAAARPHKAEGDGPMAYYYRPAGAYYVSFYTRDDQAGTWGYYSPWLHATAYVPITYVNASTGATAYSWTGLRTSGWSKEEVTSTETDFTIEHPVVLGDSVPTLTATAGEQSASYFLQGYNATPALVKSPVWTYPNWQYGSTTAMQVRHAWETSKYVALRHPRFDSEGGGSTYFTIDSKYTVEGSSKAYFFGPNTRGYDYAGIAFEKPAYPYVLNHVGMKYQSLEWAEDAATTGVAAITAMVYKLDEIPPYSEDTYAQPVLGELIASGTASLSAGLSPTSGILSIPVYDNSGVAPEITDNILVLVTGYNAEGIKEFTLLVTRDNEDEGYGELGYVGVTTDNGVAIVGLNNFLKKDYKTAPSIFIETERPWLCFNSSVEVAERAFDPEGEEYTLKLFAYHPSNEWAVSEVADEVAGAPRKMPGKVDVPAWLGLEFEDETGSGVGYSVNAIFNVEPLPDGTDYREATVRFAYPGAYLDYKVTQGSQTTAITEVKAATDNGEAPAYNVMGQRVGDDYKGIVIINGKKVVR